jgi:7,8-dihydropterin-6-yl-methyl-4-(beta-D-ribofuranosyl)aminobenzene 5'-phosphate synthase
MHAVDHFRQTQDVTITVLVDNRADLLVKSTDAVKYFTEEPLLAEHGFAALVDLKAADVKILWDAGMTQIALLENMKRMKIDPATIDKIALSHGHGDHTASVTEVIRAMDLMPKPRRWKQDATSSEMRRYAGGRRVPVVAHPAAFRERWHMPKKGKWYGPMLPPPRAEWEALGADIVLSKGPQELGPGCWTTGNVPRLSFETSGIPKTMTYREGKAFTPDYVEEDQAIVINVKNKGLIILSGCAHSGIVNTVNHACKISGVDKVYAILGGFHLARANDDELSRTVDAIKACQSKLIVPSHCTGFRAMCQFAAQMPEEFLPGVVGATYLF